MKTIEVKNRFTGNVIVSGKYESIKNCLEKNRGANLRDADLGDADLRGADLRGADLGGAYLRGAYLGDANLGDANLRGADLGGADLRGAYLRDANLRGAYLGGADLRGAYLGDAYLGDADLGVKYPPMMSHAFIAEILKRETNDINMLKWIGLILLMREWCWDDFKEKASGKALLWAKKILCGKWPEFKEHFGD